MRVHPGAPMRAVSVRKTSPTAPSKNSHQNKRIQASTHLHHDENLGPLREASLQEALRDPLDVQHALQVGHDRVVAAVRQHVVRGHQHQLTVYRSGGAGGRRQRVCELRQGSNLAQAGEIKIRLWVGRESTCIVHFHGEYNK